MKLTLTALCFAAFCQTGFSQTETTTETTETRVNGAGRKEVTTTTTTTFTPEVSTKVATYFDSYKSERYGLPPSIVAKVNAKQIPTAWHAKVAPGMVVTQEERDLLVPAPADLVQVLPGRPVQTQRYYLMGGNVVAVDTESYKVVESIQVPTVRFAPE